MKTTFDLTSKGFPNNTSLQRNLLTFLLENKIIRKEKDFPRFLKSFKYTLSNVNSKEELRIFKMDLKYNFELVRAQEVLLRTKPSNQIMVVPSAVVKDQFPACYTPKYLALIKRSGSFDNPHKLIFPFDSHAELKEYLKGNKSFSLDNLLF